ncbi:MAG: hypothetical protein ACJ79J_07810 [Gemmatimonadaceae bacterium]|jgi:hypothetical protein
MEKHRVVFVALIATIIGSASAHAQANREFDNSWFWGFKTGINTFAVPGHGNTATPDFGIDWVITRTHGGLYVSANQSIFEKDLEFIDPTSNSGQRTVRVNDMRRISAGAMVFPHHFGGITPYAGLGYAITVLGNARIFVDSANTFPTNAFMDEVENERSRASILAMGGVQLQSKKLALFGQYTILPSNSTFLFRSVLSFIEFGVRLNFGSSIDRE